ncbi:MAG: HyaD/HybD family hydrogenase maturation endopeptidase [Pseudomonadales bacterium]|nr:HyaD/HybD family hydrogenase maturation endopeptidase [Pseudomonadales bacterium]
MSSRVLVLGIGNVLWADEGFGVRAVEAFHERFEGPDSMRVMDGGTQGIYLVPHIQDADLLVIFDAIDYGLPPGTLKLLQDDDVPQFMGAKKMSLHQTGFQEVLAMAELLGGGPRAMLLVGGQPQVLEDYGGSLSPSVRAQLEPALACAVDYLQSQGVMLKPRSGVIPVAEALAPASVALQPYEALRPPESEACRQGDARVLQSSRVVFDPKPVTPEQASLSVNIHRRRPD